MSLALRTQLFRRAHIDPLVSSHDDFRNQVERDFTQVRRQMDRDIIAAVLLPRYSPRPGGANYVSSCPHHSLTTARSASSTSCHALSKVWTISERSAIFYNFIVYMHADFNSKPVRTHQSIYLSVSENWIRPHIFVWQFVYSPQAVLKVGNECQRRRKFGLNEELHYDTLLAAWTQYESDLHT